MEVKSLNNLKQNRGSIGGTSGKTKFKTIEALGFDDPKKTAYRFELLASRPDIVERVKVEAPLGFFLAPRLVISAHETRA